MPCKKELCKRCKGKGCDNCDDEGYKVTELVPIDNCPSCRNSPSSEHCTACNSQGKLYGAIEKK